jgi:hypothetical protein
MRPSPPLGTTREAEYRPEGGGDGAVAGTVKRGRLVFVGSQKPSRFTRSTGNPQLRRPCLPSAAGAGPPGVLQAGRRPDLPPGEPGPHATGRAEVGQGLRSGSRSGHARPRPPAAPPARGRQRDGGRRPPHQGHGTRKAMPGPGTGGSPTSRRPARTRPVPTAVRSGLGRRGCRDRARASRTSRCAAASALSSRPRSSARSPRGST